MSAKILLVSFLLVISLISCKKDDSATQVTPTDSPGKQHDIAWPSLANSPWPMNHHDPQSTGRSSLLGPAMGVLEGDYSITPMSYGGVVALNDTTLIVGGKITAIRMDGTIRWTYGPASVTLSNALTTTPIVTSDGKIVAASQDGIISAVRFDGTLAWQYTTQEAFIQQGTNIGLDGVFYCISMQGTLYAINPDGALKWSLKNSKFSGNERSVLTFSPDGKTLYVPGEGIAVNALDVTSQTIKWSFGNTRYLVLAPMVDCEGNIYVLGTDTSNGSIPSLFSLRSDGTIRWTFQHGNRYEPIMAGDPTIDANGNIYFAFDTLYAVDYDGHLRWKVGVQNGADVPLVCDANGTIYLTLWLNGNTETAIDTRGNTLWSTPFSSPTYFIDSSPAIVSNQRLFIQGMKNSKVYKWK